MSVAQVLAEVERDRVFFDESGGGVTFSGGEPLLQPEFLEALLRGCRDRRLHTVVDTCGLASGQVLERIRPLVDLFLFDLKLMDGEAHRRQTGAKNDVILRNLERLAASGSAVRVRLPLIPGVNDGEDNLGALAAFMRRLGLRELDLLPYHRIGTDKYQRLHLTSPMTGVEPPAPERVEAVAARLRRDGLSVRIGG